MKAIKTALLISIVGSFTACQGQTKQTDIPKKQIVTSKKDTTSKQMNFLDEQTVVFGQLFELAGAEEKNPLKGANNYKEVIRKMDLPEAQKEMLLEQYSVYDLSLDPTKKDSLKIMVDKMLTKAMEKSQNDN